MGLLRLLLAISVLSAHTAFPILIGGKYAVEIFFVLSGFLISYILVESKKYSNVKYFYYSRFLRLYPVYAVIFLVMLAFNVLYATVTKTPNLIQQIGAFDAVGQLLVWFGNISMLLQDWTLFLSQSGPTIVVGSALTTSDMHWHTGLLNPPSWSLSLEVAFYILAPWLIKTRARLISGLGFSLACKMILVFTGQFGLDPWSYRFFPAELCFFLLGAAAHRLSLILVNKNSQLPVRTLGYIALLAPVVALVAFPYIPLQEWLRAGLVLGIVLVCLPFLFRHPVAPGLQNRLGNLSYPVYLLQILVLQVLTFASSILRLSLPPIEFLIVAVCATVGLAWLLEKYFVEPLDAYRYRITNAVI